MMTGGKGSNALILLTTCPLKCYDDTSVVTRLTFRVCDINLQKGGPAIVCRLPLR